MKKLSSIYWHAFHFLVSVALAVLLWRDVQERLKRDEFMRCHNAMMEAFSRRDMAQVKIWKQKQEAAFQKAFGVTMQFIQ